LSKLAATELEEATSFNGHTIYLWLALM